MKFRPTYALSLRVKSFTCSFFVIIMERHYGTTIMER